MQQCTAVISVRSAGRIVVPARARPAGLQPAVTAHSRPNRNRRRVRVVAAAREAATRQQAPDQPSASAIQFLGVLGDGMQTVKGRLEIAADPDLVYSILTDYDSCARVFRNIAATSTRLTPDGGKQVVQACGWQFLAFSGTFNVALNVDEEPRDRLLVFRLAESSFMRDFEGRWKVEPAEGGGCVVEHVLAVKPVLSIPAAVAPYTSSIFKRQVAALLQDLEAEIRRQVADVQAATCN